MTLTEIEPMQLPVLDEATQIIARYEFDVKDQSFIADVTSYDDPRVARAIELEVDTFSELGDIPSEVREEFGPLNAATHFILLHSGVIDGQVSELVGMARLIPYTEEHGLKTFVDLGEIAAKIPEPGVQRSILEAVNIDSAEVDSIDDQHVRASFVANKIEEKFMLDYDVKDMGTVTDIATLAPDMRLDFGDKLKTIDAILAAMGIFTTDQYLDGELTHLAQFTATALHHYLRDLYKYPVRELFELEDIPYDSFGNGTDDNMVATPSIMIVDELVNDYLFAPKAPSTQIGRVSLAMAPYFEQLNPRTLAS